MYLFQCNEVEHLQKDLCDKEKTLKDNIKDIAQLDEGLLLIDEQYNGLLSERKKMEENEQTKQMKNDDNNGVLMAAFNGLDLSRTPQPANGVASRREADHGERNGVPALSPNPSEAPSTSTLLEKCRNPLAHSIHCAMRILRQNIATQKAQIMKNLELNNCDKNQLDDDIAKLQQLQKQYVQYEKDVSYNEEPPNRMEFCISDDGDISSEDLLRAISCDLNSNSSDGRENRGKYSAIGSDDTTMPANISYTNDSVINRSRLSNNCRL